MSRSSAPVLTSPSPLPLLLLLVLLLPLLLDTSTARAASTAPDIGCSARSCVALDMTLLQEYVTSLNATSSSTSLPDFTNDTDEVPFGALASDWSRLLLLQNRQPEGTPLRDNLLRLSRLMLAAYFDGLDHDDDDGDDDDDWQRLLEGDGDDGQGDDNGTISSLTESSATATAAAAAAAAAAVTATTAVPETESKDQQANNVTLGSTAQKGSAWINASTVTAAYNNETPASGGKFAGSEEDSTTTTSYYDSSSVLPNLSRTSADNEASGNASNETFTPHDNEDESDGRSDFIGSTSTETWLPQLDEPQGLKIEGEDFALTTTTTIVTDSERGSAENSQANEAVHKGSKEDFVLSQYLAKGNEAEKDEDDSMVARFFDSGSDEGSHNSNHIKSVENFFAAEAEMTGAEKTNTSATREFVKSFEETKPSLTKDIENFSTDEDPSSNNNNKNDNSGSIDASSSGMTDSLENFFASAETLENSADKQSEVSTKPPVDSSVQEQDVKSNGDEVSEELLTQSIEDFFAHEEDVATNQTESANSKNNMDVPDATGKSSEDVGNDKGFFTKIFEIFGASMESNATERSLTVSEEEFFKESEEKEEPVIIKAAGDDLGDNGTRQDEIMTEVSSSPGNSDSSLVLSRETVVNSSEMLSSANSTQEPLPTNVTTENSTSTEPNVNETPLAAYTTPPAVPSTEDPDRKLEAISSSGSSSIVTVEILKNGNLHSDELVPSGKLLAQESNSMGDEKNDDNPTTTMTTLAQLISGRLSGAYSNEITSARADPTNRTEDRSTKYLDIPVAEVISTAWSSLGEGNRTDRDKAAAVVSVAATTATEGVKARSIEFEADGMEDEGNRTTDRSDGLFREETTTAVETATVATERRPEDDWSSTPVLPSIETATAASESNEATTASDPLMTSRHESNGVATNKLRDFDASLRRKRENDARELKEGAFNPVSSSTVVSLRDQQYGRTRRSSGVGIAAGARMNKRKSRKRAVAAELDVERQYRTFFGPEPGQTQFAEKRIAAPLQHRQ